MQRGIIRNNETEPIAAEQLASLFKSTFGESGICAIADNLAAEKINNNTVRLHPGEFNLSGYILGVPAGSYEDIIIDSGTSGQNRNDLIVAEFVRNGESIGNDTLHFRVVKGTSTSGTAADPALTQQDINAAGVTRQEALYRVRLSGTTLTQIDLLATQLPNLNLVQLDIVTQEFNVTNYRTANSSGAAGSLVKSKGIVMFSGYLFVTSGLPANTSKVVMNLPAELRPKTDVYFPITIYSTTTTGTLAGFGIVGANGDVTLYNKTTNAGGDAVAMSFNYKT